MKVANHIKNKPRTTKGTFAKTKNPRNKRVYLTKDEWRLIRMLRKQKRYPKSIISR